MGHGYNHHHHRHHQYRTTFLPLLCRASTKDTKLPKCPSSTVANEPSSPKVGCMGQVKRNNRVTGFPSHHRFTTTPATATAATTAVKYTKLKKLFSSKNLTTATTTTTPAAAATSNCRSKTVVNIGELDPPLPVVKKVRAGGGGREEVCIWKRRCNGNGFKCLEIQQIQVPNTNYLPPLTV